MADSALHGSLGAHSPPPLPPSSPSASVCSALIYSAFKQVGLGSMVWFISIVRVVGIQCGQMVISVSHFKWFPWEHKSLGLWWWCQGWRTVCSVLQKCDTKAVNGKSVYIVAEHSTGFSSLSFFRIWLWNLHRNVKVIWLFGSNIVWILAGKSFDVRR